MFSSIVFGFYAFCFRLLGLGFNFRTGSNRLFFPLLILFSSTDHRINFYTRLLYCFCFLLLLWVSSTGLGFVQWFCFILQISAWFFSLFLGPW